MAYVRIELGSAPINGQELTFMAPCDCSAVTGIRVYYPGTEEGSMQRTEFSLRDTCCNDLAGASHLFTEGSHVKVTLDTVNNYAYLHSASSSRSISTYMHTSDGLVGNGENGKFKCTQSGVYSTITINGVAHTIKYGEESEIELIADCWYTFILDGTTVNFNIGGAGLNFKVVGSTVEPSSPKENTIWVNTDVTIGKWQLAADKPTTRTDGAILQEGDVWIKTDASRDAKINIIKSNGITVGLAEVYQYISNSWVQRQAYVRVANEWKPISYRYYLIEDGKYVNVSDDWNRSGVTFTDESDAQYCIRLSFMSLNNAAAIAVNNTAIDVTNYTKICIEVPCVSIFVSNTTYFALSNSNDTNTAFISTNHRVAIHDAGTYRIGISELSGNKYFKLFNKPDNSSMRPICRIKNIWLE